MRKLVLWFGLALLLGTLGACFSHADASASGFKVIPLGVKGGSNEANLSAYLVSAQGSDNYICLDAGTIYAGLLKAMGNQLFAEKNVEAIQRNNIKAYFISHAHLDHAAGLVLNSPSDSAKTIYGFPFVLDVLRTNYFSWRSWVNFANEGEVPTLNKYTYGYLTAGQEVDVASAALQVTPFVLSHSTPYQSSAFMVRSLNNHLLYLGDTGADALEKSSRLKELWTAAAEKIKRGELTAIFVEVSFDNATPDAQLFGHLTPRLLMQEMHVLNTLAEGRLRNVKIFVTHMKPCDSCESTIKNQIASANDLGLDINYPEQGQLIELVGR